MNEQPTNLPCLTMSLGFGQAYHDKGLLSRATKIILYKTLIRPVVSYGAEAWTLTKKEEQALLIFERKM